MLFVKGFNILSIYRHTHRYTLFIYKNIIKNSTSQIAQYFFSMVNVIISVYVMKFLSKSQFVIKIKFRHACVY